MQKIRTALKRFPKYGFLTVESTPHNRLITIVNWGFYQEGENIATDGTTDGTTDEQQTPNKQVTTNKNVKNEENEKKSNRRKPVYDETSIFYQLAFTLYKQLKTNQLERKERNLQNWANDFRLMVERVKRTVEQIKYLMKWSGQHPF